ncbi:MAG: methyltransferase domain-containing protein [Desulfuromonadales bacterium]|nr:methyltransferase domain-containing protein [Desulfuromonadales bacterium]
MIKFDYYVMRFRECLDALRDLLGGAYYGGVIKSRYGHLGANATGSSFYFVLSQLFREYPLKESDVLVDVGCGKGRVIHWWLRNGCRNRIIGIELDEEIAARSRKTFAGNAHVEILSGNALDLVPPAGTLFYLYNPFNREVVRAFKDRLNQVCTNRLDLRIYYVNCEYLDAFKGDPEWEVRTNFDSALNDPEWRPEKLPFGLSYPVAIIKLRG